jgi:acyl-CoA synthetase (AMP-forming)/AMP-acid ligase II
MACKTLAEVVQTHAVECGASAALESARSGDVVEYRQLRAHLGRWARRLESAGVPPDAPVVLDTCDPIDFAIAYVAVVASGRCAVPVDPRAPLPDVLRALHSITPAAVVGDRPDLAAALDAAALSPHPEPIVDADAEVPLPYAGTGSVLLSTSGSTGTPKGVRLSEQQLLHVSQAIATHNRLERSDRGYNCLPLFHVNAEVVALLATLHAGACLVLDARFHVTGFWELLRGKRITWLNAVPAMLTVLTAEPAIVDVPDNLRFVRSASAPLPVVVRQRLSGVTVVESYGMTEAASQITATPLGESAPPGSCGRPVAVELELRDEQGAVLPPNRVGRVHIRGTGVIAGYTGAAAAERFDAQGWLDTGDVGRIDEAGFVHLAGRSDDVINRGGELVYPREIEEVLLTDPAVREVVVVGREHPVLGQVPVAFAIAHPDCDDHDTVRETLRLRCEHGLARFKHPAEFHFVADFPRAATGKIQRHRLCEPTTASR